MQLKKTQLGWQGIDVVVGKIKPLQMRKVAKSLKDVFDMPGGHNKAIIRHVT